MIIAQKRLQVAATTCYTLYAQLRTEQNARKQEHKKDAIISANIDSRCFRIHKKTPATIN